MPSISWKVNCRDEKRGCHAHMYEVSSSIRCRFVTSCNYDTELERRSRAKNHLGVAIFPHGEEFKLWRHRHCGAGALFDYDHRIRRKPLTIEERSECCGATVLAVGWIHEHEIERSLRSAAAKLRGISPPDLAYAGNPQGFCIAPNDRAGLRVNLHELTKPGSARERFETERTAAGKEIQDAPACDRIARSFVGQNIEDRLPDTIAGRPGRMSGGRNQTVPAILASDDSHLRSTGLFMVPSCSRRTRGETSSMSPRPRSPS